MEPWRYCVKCRGTLSGKDQSTNSFHYCASVSEGNTGRARELIKTASVSCVERETTCQRLQVQLPATARGGWDLFDTLGSHGIGATKTYNKPMAKIVPF